MSLLQRVVKSLGGLGLLVSLPAMVYGQPVISTNFYAPQAGEYDAIGALPGDQANPALSLNTKGGYLVYQDNVTDTNGLGISAVSLNNTFSPSQPPFRVNVQDAGDQENPQVALLAGGGAAFVWQGGQVSAQHIYARFLSASNVWLSTNDIEVNTATNFQIDPAIAALPNGNVVVTWSSYGQDNPDGLLGVYGQILSPTGQKIGGEFQVNQFTPFNQRSPAVAVFPGGNFIVTWISEMERSSATVASDGSYGGGYNSVDVYARMFDSTGNPGSNNEFLVNTTTNICANPSVAIDSAGGYLIAWSEFDPNPAVANNGWDILGRKFNSAGTGLTNEVLINSQRYGDQYAPKVSSDGTNYLVVWTSMGQDGSLQGVFSQFLNSSGGHAGGEQQVNTVVLNQQEFPAVASDGAGSFVVVWSSFISVADGLDVRAQRYVTTLQPLPAPAAPMVLALDSYSLSVTWPLVTGYNVSYYEIFEDGSTTPQIVLSNLFSDLNCNPSETHTFQLAYVLTDGTVSPLSPVASGTTWGRMNAGGLPSNWEALYYGTNQANWPALGSFTQLAPGVTVGDVFNWGANPTNPSTWLTQTITKTSAGLFLNWNTVPGGIYQVLYTSDLQTWTPLGSPRFEPGSTDSVSLGTGGNGYYRIVRNRY
jgi:hypothetical protein